MRKRRNCCVKCLCWQKHSIKTGRPFIKAVSHLIILLFHFLVWR